MMTENQEKVLSMLKAEGVDILESRRAAWSLIECVATSACISEYGKWLVDNMHLSSCDELIDELRAIAAYSGVNLRSSISRSAEAIQSARDKKTEQTKKW